MYESPVVNVVVLADPEAASNELGRWETPIDPQ